MENRENFLYEEELLKYAHCLYKDVEDIKYAINYLKTTVNDFENDWSSNISGGILEDYRTAIREYEDFIEQFNAFHNVIINGILPSAEQAHSNIMANSKRSFNRIDMIK